MPSKTAFSWAHVDDIARGHILAMEQGKVGESYIIAGPTHTLIEGMQLAQKITGVPMPCLRMSPGMMKAMSATMGVVEKVFPVPADYSAEYLRINAGVTYIGSNAKAWRELGYTPRPLEEGLLTVAKLCRLSYTICSSFERYNRTDGKARTETVAGRRSGS